MYICTKTKGRAIHDERTSAMDEGHGHIPEPKSISGNTLMGLVATIRHVAGQRRSLCGRGHRKSGRESSSGVPWRQVVTSGGLLLHIACHSEPETPCGDPLTLRGALPDSVGERGSAWSPLSGPQHLLHQTDELVGPEGLLKGTEMFFRKEGGNHLVR